MTLRQLVGAAYATMVDDLRGVGLLVDEARRRVYEFFEQPVEAPAEEKKQEQSKQAQAQREILSVFTSARMPIGRRRTTAGGEA